MPRFLSSNKAIARALATVGAAIMVIGAMSSLWFLRGAWGDSSPIIEFGYQNTIPFPFQFFEQKTGLNQQDVYRLTYGQNENGEYMSVVPRFTTQFTMKARLRKANWEVRRVGWIIFASRGSQEYHLADAVIAQVTAMLQNKLPASPIFFMRSREKDDTPLAIYAEQQRGSIHASASIDSFNFVASKTKQPKDKEGGRIHTLIVALPSGLFRSMHKEFFTSFEGSLARMFHFQKTTPRMLSIFSGTEDIYLLVGEKEIAVGVQKQGDVFGKTVLNLMNKEQGQAYIIVPNGVNNVSRCYARGFVYK